MTTPLLHLPTTTSVRSTWFAAMLAATFGVSYVFTCAAPFAALAAVAALVLPMRGAVLLSLAAWAMNQFTGFAFAGVASVGSAELAELADTSLADSSAALPSTALPATGMGVSGLP